MAQTQPETQQFAAGQTGKGATGRNPNEPKGDPAEPKNGAGTASDTDPTEMLKSDHQHVEQLFSSFEEASETEQKSQLAAHFCTELMVHTLLEEEIKHHVREEEKSDGVLAKAKDAGVATSDLAKRMATRKQELMEQAKAASSRPAGDAEFPRSNQCRDQSAISGRQDGTRIKRNNGTRARRARAFCERRRRRSRLSPTFVQPQPVR